MFEVSHIHHNDQSPVDDWLDLPYEFRCRSRFRFTSRSGADVGVILERGFVLDIGDVLSAADGRRFGINAANETVVTAYADDWNQFARACYHLGNRHVPMQIGERWLRIQPDHVLQQLITNFGLRIENELAPFRPEGGAYSSAGKITAILSHSHGHAHGHVHTPGHHDHHHN